MTASIGDSSATTYITQSSIFTDDYIGRILLSDGTIVLKENFDISTMIPVAIVSGLKNDGYQIIAVGLRKGTNLERSPSGTGFYENFTEIQGTTTSGDMDGSDNWDYICGVDPTGTANAATNYPAFNFVNTYGITAGLTGTGYENGWYLPAIAELDVVYDNRSIIQESLDVVGGFTIGTSYYWSSSQYASDGRIAYELNFSNGKVGANGLKFHNYNVLVLRAFNAQ